MPNFKNPFRFIIIRLLKKQNKLCCRYHHHLFTLMIQQKWTLKFRELKYISLKKNNLKIALC